jgi:cell division protein FtsI (penicillin-binding protein 3)
MVERRLTWLARIVLLWGAVIFCQLVSIQVLRHREYTRLAKSRQELVIDIPGPRGAIFDRTGRPLAMSVPAESVFVNPQKIQDLEFASDLLARALDLDRGELYAEMKQAFDNKRGFLWIKRKLDEHESQRIRGLQQEWIGIQKESQRRYPKGKVAAHLLGSVNYEENGNAGIEKALNDVLRGQPGRMRLLTDVKRRGIDSQFESEARAGVPITLTIDERIQFVAERELAAAVHHQQAVSGSLVVMNPFTGDILALASYPTYDPNISPQRGEEMARRNHAVSVPFEPGSVFKVITFSAAFETTALTPDTLIDCRGGVLRLPGRVIHDAHLGTGVLPAGMVFAKSSNIGSIDVGGRAGKENLYQYCRLYGFGQKTGITLPAESAGKLRRLDRWGTTSWASISIGQEISVTTVQLSRAASVIANGGFLVKPRLVLKKGDAPSPPPEMIRVLKPQTALTLQRLMENVVLQGTGSAAKLAGYTAAGKTGSAQIYDFAAKHYTHTYNASFMGFAPLNRPAFVMVATLNGTRGTRGFGGAAAAPVFRAVATEALRVMEIPRDLPDEPVLVTENRDVNDLAIATTPPHEANILEEGEDEEELASLAGQGARGRGPGPASVESPAAGQGSLRSLGPGTQLASLAGQGSLRSPGVGTDSVEVAAGPIVPDFRGMSLRAVLADAAQRGLTVVPDGSGTARGQSPPAGSVLRHGQSIRVQFAR